MSLSTLSTVWPDPDATARCLMLVLTLGGALSSAAAWQARQVEDAAPVIQHARVDLTARTITIEGGQFGASLPVVTLDRFELLVLAATSTRIIARVPDGVPPDRYMLTVAAGSSFQSRVRLQVIIGGPPDPDSRS